MCVKSERSPRECRVDQGIRWLGRITTTAVLTGLASLAIARADTVTDWNGNFFKAAKVAAQLPPVEARCAAIMQTAVYDAVNGIARQYEPYLVNESAPQGARADAAAVTAAYTVLKALYPSQSATFDAELADSIDNLPGSNGKSPAIARGLAWGQHVANLVLAARSVDGFSASVPGYFGNSTPGVWRSLPVGTNADGTLPAVLPQLRYVTPFAMLSPDQFRPGAPPALTSAQYAADVNETMSLGSVNSATRTAEQTETARLWQAANISDLLQGAVAAMPANNTLVENARLLALLSFASCDGLIAVFDAKYTYNRWRPYHAIRLADTDGNPLTSPDTAWTSLIFPPRHQEYPSAHCVATTAFMRVLTRELGDENPFTLSSPGLPNVTRTFQRFSDAAAQVKEARIWAGIHFRTSCDVGAAVGRQLGDYIADNLLLPVHSDPGSED